MKKSLPGWFGPLLAVATVVMVLSGLQVARDKGVIRESK